MRKHMSRTGTRVAVAILAAGAGVGAAQAAGLTRGAVTPSPTAGGAATAPVYTPAPGPALSDPAIAAIARNIAAEAHDPEPTQLTAVNTTLGAAMHASAHDATPARRGAAMAAIAEAPAVVVSMRGHFTLTDAPVPRGRPQPSGVVLTVTIDARTGVLETREVGDAEPPGLRSLGSVRSVG